MAYQHSLVIQCQIYPSRKIVVTHSSVLPETVFCYIYVYKGSNQQYQDDIKKKGSTEAAEILKGIKSRYMMLLILFILSTPITVFSTDVNFYRLFEKRHYLLISGALKIVSATYQEARGLYGHLQGKNSE